MGNYLTLKNLEALKNVELQDQLLSQYRDIYLFECLFELTHEQASRLNGRNILMVKKDEYVINVDKRDETVNSLFRLTDMAKSIIDRYNLNETCLYGDTLLPKIDVMDYYQCLPEFFALAGIEIELSAELIQNSFVRLIQEAESRKKRP